MFIPEGSVTSRRVCKPWAQNGVLELRKAGDKTLTDCTANYGERWRDERVAREKETKSISKGGGEEKMRSRRR